MNSLDICNSYVHLTNNSHQVTNDITRILPVNGFKNELHICLLQLKDNALHLYSPCSLLILKSEQQSQITSESNSALR